VAGKSGTTRIWSDGAYQTGEYFASFVGFFPAEDPQLVVMVKLDRPQGTYYGGSAAAPVTRATMEAVLAARETPIDRRALVAVARAQALEVSPGEDGAREVPTVARFADLRIAESPRSWSGRDQNVEALPESVRPEASAAADGSTVIVPNVLGLSTRAAARRIHETGLRVEWGGSGVVSHMVPPAGSILASGDTVRVVSVRESGGE
jgi:hypothetical protein